ncbi:7298_t:CDS:2 [Funneliformis mosseae]|uniref:7298_t:CDS:1 n=1 Tax=Funneliformis mosseae TaxID=27381 RepID=A0A9N8VPX6_FUNMO|nr:7298_t:CDS:2 [Funneliformis mosseae]
MNINFSNDDNNNDINIDLADSYLNNNNDNTNVNIVDDNSNNKSSSINLADNSLDDDSSDDNWSNNDNNNNFTYNADGNCHFYDNNTELPRYTDDVNLTFQVLLPYRYYIVYKKWNRSYSSHNQQPDVDAKVEI